MCVRHKHQVDMTACKNRDRTEEVEMTFIVSHFYNLCFFLSN